MQYRQAVELSQALSAGAWSSAPAQDRRWYFLELRELLYMPHCKPECLQKPTKPTHIQDAALMIRHTCSITLLKYWEHCLLSNVWISDNPTYVCFA